MIYLLVNDRSLREEWREVHRLRLVAGEPACFRGLMLTAFFDRALHGRRSPMMRLGIAWRHWCIPDQVLMDEHPTLIDQIHLAFLQRDVALSGGVPVSALLEIAALDGGRASHDAEVSDGRVHVSQRLATRAPGPRPGHLDRAALGGGGGDPRTVAGWLAGRSRRRAAARAAAAAVGGRGLMFVNIPVTKTISLHCDPEQPGSSWYFQRYDDFRTSQTFTTEAAAMAAWQQGELIWGR